MSSFVGLLFVRIHGGNQRMVCTVGHATHARVAHAALYLFHHRCPIGRAQTLVLRRLQMVGARRPCSSVHFGPCRTRRNIFLRTALFGRRFRFSGVSVVSFCFATSVDSCRNGGPTWSESQDVSLNPLEKLLAKLGAGQRPAELLILARHAIHQPAQRQHGLLAIGISQGAKGRIEHDVFEAAA